MEHVLHHLRDIEAASVSRGLLPGQGAVAGVHIVQLQQIYRRIARGYFSPPRRDVAYG